MAHFNFAKLTGRSYLQLSQELRKFLAANGFENAEMEANALLGGVFGEALWQKKLDPSQKPNQQELATLDSFVQRRVLREPLSHILGEKGFWTLDLLVNKHVLTPRADSECLVETALANTKHLPAGKILDLGTGSGALLLAFLSERPNWQGVGVDLSPAALEIAKQNAKRCELSSQVNFVHSHWKDLAEKRYDLVLSNPPYIAQKVLDELEPEVREYEPHLALAGGADGLDAYRELAILLPKFLNLSGQFVFEIGFDQAKAVQQILSQVDGIAPLHLIKDLGGRDRALHGCFQYSNDEGKS